MTASLARRPARTAGLTDARRRNAYPECAADGNSRIYVTHANEKNLVLGHLPINNDGSPGTMQTCSTNVSANATEEGKEKPASARIRRLRNR